MTRLITLLAVNAVPAAGWFIGNWSAGTTLAVYWFENLAGSVCIAVLIGAHQRVRPRRGHFAYQAPDRRGAQSSSFLSGFLITSLAFCAAHGIFLGVILLVLDHSGERGLAVVDWPSVLTGCVIVLVLLVIDLAVDLVRVRSWTFLRIERTAYRGLGRVVIVHLTLIFGLFGMAMTDTPAALFGIFVVLKTLYALTMALPQWEPATAPARLSRVMNRLPNVHPGDKFEDRWVRDRATEADRRERNERPWAGVRR